MRLSKHKIIPMFTRPVYTPTLQGESGSLETEEAPITYIFSEQENPWTVLDTGHLYRRTGEQEEEEEE